MSAWRQSLVSAFPDAKQELLELGDINEVWPFLVPRLDSAVVRRDTKVLDQFLSFAEWVLTPRTGSRPGGSLKSLTGPVIEFIVTHVDLLFEARNRQDFFRIQPGLRYHLSKDDMKIFDAFLQSTPEYIKQKVQPAGCRQRRDRIQVDNQTSSARRAYTGRWAK